MPICIFCQEVNVLADSVSEVGITVFFNDFVVVKEKFLLQCSIIWYIFSNWVFFVEQMLDLSLMGDIKVDGDGDVAFSLN